MKNSDFQRVDAQSNAHAGRQFEQLVKAMFIKNGFELSESISVMLGFGVKQKSHKFDLGSIDQSILIECKSHRWTTGDNTPSAKLTVWNEAMLYFFLSPESSRKLFCVLKDYSEKRQMSLADYYCKTHGHLIPSDVEIWEIDERLREASQIYGPVF